MSRKWKNSRSKIPKFILQEILQNDKRLYKALLIYLDLKPLFYTGVFHQAKRRHKSIAAFLRISPRSLHYKFKSLEDHGFISFDQKGDLILCSWVTFFKKFGIECKDPRKLKFYQVKNIYNLDLLSRRLIIEENFKKQEKAINKKIYSQQVLEERQIKVLKDLKELDQSDIPTKDRERIRERKLLEIRSYEVQKRQGNQREFQKLKKSGLWNYHYMDALRKWYHNERTFNFNHPVNFDISLSCQSVANLFGLASKSSGYYWEKKLNESGYCEKKPRSIYIPKVQNWAVQFSRSQDLEHHYFIGAKGDGVYKRQNNLLIFAPLVRA